MYYAEVNEVDAVLYKILDDLKYEFYIISV